MKTTIIRNTALSLCLIFAQTSYVQADDDIETSSWDISGYLKLVAEQPTDNSQASKLELDDLSLFISANVNKWFNPFIEAEYFGDELLNSKQGADKSNGKFIAERIYNDFQVNGRQRIRVGKFLAPLGYWNLIHAAPLVWSTNRPISAGYSFANYITGFEYGQVLDFSSGSRFDLYWQPAGELNPKPLSSHPRHYQQVFGGSWTLFDDLDGRASFDIQYAKVKHSESKRTTVSFQQVKYFQQWDLDTQAIYTFVNELSNDEDGTLVTNNKENGWDGGAYIQLRYRYKPFLHFYSRAEYFHYSIVDDSARNLIIGARTIWGQWGNLNLEYKAVSGAALAGTNNWSLSYNVMFKW